MLSGLREIVDEADEPHTDHHEDDEKSTGRRRIAVNRVTEEITETGADDNDDSTHRWCATLCVVALWTVIANELPPPDPLEEPDENGSHEEREKERETCTEKKGPHRSSLNRWTSADIVNSVDPVTRMTTPSPRNRVSSS